MKLKLEIRDLLKLYPESSFERETNSIYEDFRKTHDALIVNHKQVLAIFCFKNISIETFNSDFSDAPNSSIYDYKFYIITDGSLFKVLNRNSSEISEFEEAGALINSLMLVPSEKELTNTIREIAHTIHKTVSNYFRYFEIKSHLLTKIRNKVIEHFSENNITRNILYHKHGQYFHFAANTNDLSNFENTFFQMLLKKVDSETLLYRYCDIESMFSTLSNNSIRLNGIAAMNDISEVGYVERYIDRDHIMMKNKRDVNRINDKFIYSSTVLKDDLMHWRLYGDDSKGACLTFKAKGGGNYFGIQLKKVNYGIERDGLNYHPELELVSKIREAVKKINKESIQFRTLNVWKHFFKSYEYRLEQEVRLLISLRGSFILGEHLKENNNNIIKKSWGLTKSYKILNPFIIFSFENKELPLELVEITLGNKCPEIETNKKQLEEYLINHTINTIVVNKSKIDNYR